MIITKHFKLEEFTNSPTAKSKEIENSIDDIQHLFNLYAVCQELEKVREFYNSPVIVSSGYRNGKLNEAVGGVPNSQHRLGQAVDFTVKGVDNKEVVKWISENCFFDQLILEEYESEESQGWIHLSVTKSGNRRKILAYNNKKYRAYRP